MFSRILNIRKLFVLIYSKWIFVRKILKMLTCCTVPNMTVRVTSKSTYRKFLKKFNQRFDEFFDACTAIFVAKHG